MAASRAAVGAAVEARARRARLLLALLCLALVAAALASVGAGAVPIAPGHALAILVEGIGGPPTTDRGAALVLLSIRLPRAVLALLVGGSLGVAGAALQGLFRNPLADPQLIGVSLGAALAAAAVIVLGGAAAARLPAAALPWLLPLAAFAGGLATTVGVQRIAGRDGRTDVATMLLAGVAFNALAASGIGLLIFLSTDQQLRDLQFWLLGSLGGVTWERLAPAAPMILLPTLLLLVQARPLDALLLGEADAFHLGFDVERAKRRIVVLAALAVGAGVALVGTIGFVGLVVPHLVRLAVGPDHRVLLPASALLGATLMLVADLLARIVVLPAELPVGILTSLVGGPFFLWLLMRRRDGGLW